MYVRAAIAEVEVGGRSSLVSGVEAWRRMDRDEDSGWHYEPVVVEEGKALNVNDASVADACRLIEFWIRRAEHACPIPAPWG